MANAKVCDRCRRIIKPGYVGDSKVKIDTTRYSYMWGNRLRHEELDLCDGCTIKLKVFLSKADIDVTEECK